MKKNKVKNIKQKKNNLLKDRIKTYNGPNLCKEFVWDKQLGKEIW